MRQIRIGKDIHVKWKLTINDGDVALTSADLTIVLTDAIGRETVMAHTTSGTCVEFDYLGTAQHRLGKYRLTAWLNKGNAGQTAVDEVEAFKLVPFSSDESEDDDNNLETETVEITSEMAVGIEGISAYQSWLNQGNTGTEAEFLASLKGNKGNTGATGNDGVSPTVTISKDGTVTTITITDKDGIHTATINDGEQGKAGTTDYNELTNKPTIPTKTSDLTNDSNFVVDSDYVHTDNNYDASAVAEVTKISSKAEQSALSDLALKVTEKQDTLVSGTNIKTINNTSLLGSGNITIEGGGGGSSSSNFLPLLQKVNLSASLTDAKSVYVYGEYIYIMFSNSFHKYDKDFNLIYIASLPTSIRTGGTSYNQSLIVAFDNVVFVEMSYSSRVLYRYDETTATGSFVDLSETYYGFLFKYDTYLIEAHNYDISRINKIDVDGNIISTIDTTDYGVFNYQAPDGRLLSTTGYIYDPSDDTFVSTGLTNLVYASEDNSVFIVGNSYGISIYNSSYSVLYTFSNIIDGIPFVISYNYGSMTVVSGNALHEFTFPYGVNNTVGRMCSLIKSFTIKNHYTFIFSVGVGDDYVLLLHSYNNSLYKLIL